MRILILLLFIPSISFGSTHTPALKGQVCTKNDLRHGDPGCCTSILLDCSQVGVGNATCCNLNSQCTWVTEKVADKNKQNTCQVNSSIACTAETKDYCIITEGANHGDILSATGNKTRCVGTHSGNCKYECYGGAWHKVTNSCKRKCGNKSGSGNARGFSGTFNHEATKTVNCLSNFRGSRTYRCNNGTWDYVSGVCTADVGCSAQSNYNNSNCNLAGSPDNSSSGSCSQGYSGSCSFSCDNGNWTQTSNSCTATSVPCSATVKDIYCHLTASSHGATSGKCAWSGGNPEYNTGDRDTCQYRCNNGTWEKVKNKCVRCAPGWYIAGNSCCRWNSHCRLRCDLGYFQNLHSPTEISGVNRWGFWCEKYLGYCPTKAGVKFRVGNNTELHNYTNLTCVPECSASQTRYLYSQGGFTSYLCR